MTMKYLSMSLVLILIGAYLTFLPTSTNAYESPWHDIYFYPMDEDGEKDPNGDIYLYGWKENGDAHWRWWCATDGELDYSRAHTDTSRCWGNGHKSDLMTDSCDSRLPGYGQEHILNAENEDIWCCCEVLLDSADQSDEAVVDENGDDTNNYQSTNVMYAEAIKGEYYEFDIGISNPLSDSLEFFTTVEGVPEGWDVSFEQNIEVEVGEIEWMGVLVLVPYEVTEWPVFEFYHECENEYYDQSTTI